MSYKIQASIDNRYIKPSPSGALILALYRDDIRKSVGDPARLDPLLRAAFLEAAGVAALHQGRRDSAAQYFDRADDSLAASGRVRGAEAAA